jgi:hypothetical protein
VFLIKHKFIIIFTKCYLYTPIASIITSNEHFLYMNYYWVQLLFLLLLLLLLSVGVDIPGFIIKGYTDIFVPILKHIFNLSLPQQCFPTLWKKAAIVPVFKKGENTSVSSYKPISPSIIFPSNLLFIFVIKSSYLLRIYS